MNRARWIILAILVAVLVWNCSVAQADTWLTAIVHSYHYNRSVDHEENNWGLGVEHRLSQDWAAALGGYRNSYGERSYYAGAAWMPIHRGYFHFGLAGGVVNGYSRHPFSGFLMPSMAIQDKNVGLNIGIVPAFDQMFTVIGFQLKVRFR